MDEAAVGVLESAGQQAEAVIPCCNVGQGHNKSSVEAEIVPIEAEHSRGVDEVLKEVGRHQPVKLGTGQFLLNFINTGKIEFKDFSQTEPPRESWRLHSLRGWSDGKDKQVSPGRS